MRQVGWAEATSGSLMLFLGRHPGPSPAQANHPALQLWSLPTLGPGQPRALARCRSPAPQTNLAMCSEMYYAVSRYFRCLAVSY